MTIHDHGNWVYSAVVEEEIDSAEKLGGLISAVMNEVCQGPRVSLTLGAALPAPDGVVLIFI